jgi:hypothetical protein
MRGVAVMKKGQRKPNAKKRSVYQRKYNGTSEQLANRTSRNKARRKMVKKVGKSAVKGKDVHHKDGNPKNNSKGNLSVSSVKKNRKNNKRK